MMVKCTRCGDEYPEEQLLCSRKECRARDVKGLAFPPEGGVLMYVWDYRYPMLGLPTKDALKSTDAMKRTILATLRLFSKDITFYFRALFMRKKLLSNMITWIEDIYSAEYEKVISPMIAQNVICRSSRELRRAFVKLYGQHKWFDCLLGMHETDTAYRYRIQDILGEIDKEAMRKNTIREVGRLFSIGIERNGKVDTHVANKLRMFRKLIVLPLFLSPSFRKEIVRFCEELNIEQVCLTENDRYWVGKIYDFNYDFEGKDWKSRSAYAASMDKGWTEDPRPPKKEPEKPKT